jgi:hypothetical protein
MRHGWRMQSGIPWALARLSWQTIAAIGISSIIPTPSRAQEKPARSCVLAVAPFGGAGLSPQILTATASVVRNAFASMGCEVAATTDKKPLKPTCLDNPACVRRALEQSQAEGLFVLQLVRVGPSVSMVTRLFSRETGAEAIRASFTAPTQAFPASWNARSDLAPVLATLGLGRSESARATNPPDTKPAALADNQGSSAKSPDVPASSPATSTNILVPPSATAAPTPNAATADSSHIDLTTKAPPPAPPVIPLVVLGGGLVFAGAGGLTAYLESGVLSDEHASGSAKGRARTFGRIGLGVAAAGIVAVAVGGILSLAELGSSSTPAP